MSAGMKLLHSILATGEVKGFLQLGVSSEHFGVNEVDIYDTIKSHIQKYGTIPAISTIEQKYGLSVVKPAEPTLYYVDELKNKYLHRELKTSILTASNHLKDMNPSEALEKLTSDLLSLSLNANQNKIMDFRESKDILMSLYKKAFADDGSSGLSFGWEYLDDMTGGVSGGDVVSIVGRPAMGKAQPLTAKIKMANGTWKTMGDLDIGDSLASIDGRESKVTGLHPQGDKKVYTMVFQDGRTTECCAEHLWEVTFRKWQEPRVVQTKDLIGMLKNPQYKKRLSIRLVSGDFGTKKTPVDPWLLGFLLGDGGFTDSSVMFSTADHEVVSKIKSIVGESNVVFRSNYDWAISGYTPIIEALRYFRLWGKKSECKFIPKIYLEGDRDTRLQVLQGLMDSDGWVEKTGATVFASTSKDLAVGVQELVRSLGGIAKIRYKENNHLGSFVVNLRLQTPKDLFTLPRKQDRCKDSASHAGKPYTLSLRLDDILEQVAPKPCQCITVSHASSLYITDDYIVTHNTFLLLFMALNAWKKGGVPILFVSMEMKPEVIFQRLATMFTGVPLTHLMKGDLSTKDYKDFFKTITGLVDNDAPFYVVDGNLSSTAEDIWVLGRQLKPDALFIDGAYLVRHPDTRLNKYARIEANCEIFKTSLAGDLDIPVCLSYQFNREAVKTKKDETAGLEHIAGSDAIGQLSSVVLGLMQSENVETLSSRVVDILKGRNGEQGQFPIHWDFQTMNFTQKNPLTLEDMDVQ